MPIELYAQFGFSRFSFRGRDGMAESRAPIGQALQTTEVTEDTEAQILGFSATCLAAEGQPSNLKPGNAEE